MLQHEGDIGCLQRGALQGRRPGHVSPIYQVPPVRAGGCLDLMGAGPGPRLPLVATACHYRSHPGRWRDQGFRGEVASPQAEMRVSQTQLKVNGVKPWGLSCLALMYN